MVVFINLLLPEKVRLHTLNINSGMSRCIGLYSPRFATAHNASTQVKRSKAKTPFKESVSYGMLKCVYILWLLFSLVLCALLGGCSIQKRSLNPGLYVEWRKDHAPKVEVGDKMKPICNQLSQSEAERLPAQLLASQPIPAKATFTQTRLTRRKKQFEMYELFEANEVIRAPFNRPHTRPQLQSDTIYLSAEEIDVPQVSNDDVSIHGVAYGASLLLLIFALVRLDFVVLSVACLFAFLGLIAHIVSRVRRNEHQAPTVLIAVLGIILGIAATGMIAVMSFYGMIFS